MAATFYFIAVGKDYKLFFFEHEIPRLRPSWKFLIKCSFLRYSDSRKHIFYRYEVIDSKSELVPENRMIFENLSLEIEKEDYWGSPFGSHNNVIIQFKIKDNIGEVKIFPMDNEHHNLNPFKNIFEYMKQLTIHRKHREVERLMAKKPSV